MIESPHPYLHTSEGPALRFIVYGDPKGYLTTHTRATWTKAIKRYRDWRSDVCDSARDIGIPTPLYCAESYPIWIGTCAYYQSSVHCDPGNTHKGAIDALFYGTIGPGDKFASGSFDSPLYDKKNPRTLIEIRGHLLRRHANLVSHSWDTLIP